LELIAEILYFEAMFKLKIMYLSILISYHYVNLTSERVVTYIAFIFTT